MSAHAATADLIGPHGGPAGLCGFRILTNDDLNSSCGEETPETVGASGPVVGVPPLRV